MITAVPFLIIIILIIISSSPNGACVVSKVFNIANDITLSAPSEDYKLQNQGSELRLETGGNWDRAKVVEADTYSFSWSDYDCWTEDHLVPGALMRSPCHERLWATSSISDRHFVAVAGVVRFMTISINTKVPMWTANSIPAMREQSQLVLLWWRVCDRQWNRFEGGVTHLRVATPHSENWLCNFATVGNRLWWGPGPYFERLRISDGSSIWMTLKFCSFFFGAVKDPSPSFSSINIATGETSQAITPFHFYDNFNFHH